MTKREEAIKWWNNLDVNIKSVLSNKYFKDTVNYNFTCLTGREIEQIYNKENNPK